MRNRVYTSMEEIDKDLKILQLRRQISQEEIKGGYSRLKQRLEPPEFISALGGSVIKNALITWLVSFILKKFRT